MKESKAVVCQRTSNCPERQTSQVRARLRLYAWLLLLLAVFINCSVIAAEPVAQSPPLRSIKSKALTDIQTNFRDLIDSSQPLTVSSVETTTHNLRELRDVLGLSSLELISLAFLELGNDQLEIGKRDVAESLLRSAEVLSPRSSRMFLQRSSSTLKLHGYLSALGDVWRMIRWSLGSSDVVIGLMADVSVGLLKSLSLASYCLLVVALSSHFIEILRRIVSLLPHGIRGLIGPLLVSILLLVPALLGLLQAIVLYSLIVVLFLPERKRIAGIGGLVLVFWFGVYPTSMAVSAWFAQRDNHLVLQTSDNGAVGIDLLEIQAAASRVSMPQLARYGLSLRHLLAGDVSKVVSELSRDTALLPSFAELELQAIIFYERGDILAADQRFDDLEREGLASARFFVNRATVKSALLDSKSARAYFEKALALDEAILEGGELSSDLKSANSLKVPSMSFGSAFGEVVQAVRAGINWFLPFPDPIFSGYPPIIALVAGLVLVSLSILYDGQFRVGKPCIYIDYKVRGLAVFIHAFSSSTLSERGSGLDTLQVVGLSIIFFPLLLLTGTMKSSQLVLGSIDTVLQPIYLIATIVSLAWFGYLYLSRWWNDE